MKNSLQQILVIVWSLIKERKEILIVVAILLGTYIYVESHYKILLDDQKRKLNSIERGIINPEPELIKNILINSEELESVLPNYNQFKEYPIFLVEDMSLKWEYEELTNEQYLKKYHKNVPDNLRKQELLQPTYHWKGKSFSLKMNEVNNTSYYSSFESFIVLKIITKKDLEQSYFEHSINKKVFEKNKPKIINSAIKNYTSNMLINHFTTYQQFNRNQSNIKSKKIYLTDKVMYTKYFQNQKNKNLRTTHENLIIVLEECIVHINSVLVHNPKKINKDAENIKKWFQNIKIINNF